MGNKTSRQPNPTKLEKPQSSNEEAEVFVGSGNVFADLGLPNPEERLQKANIANRIEDLLEADGLHPTQAAQIMGISPEDVSDILRGRLKDYPLEHLFQCLAALLYYNFTALDQSLEIIFKPSTEGGERARLLVQPYRQIVVT